MATNIRPEISSKNKYWIDKHRFYELKHFCLQYPTWKKTYEALDELGMNVSMFDRQPTGNGIGDLTAKYAIRKAYYSDKIEMIQKAAMEADEELYIYILKAVTEGLSYAYLATRMDLPCSRDTYYDRYRRFFWILSEVRD